MVEQLTEAKDYIAHLAMAKTALSVSDVIIFGIALSYFEPLKFLSFTCLSVILSGSIMTYETLSAGSTAFTIAYLISESFGSANFVITRTVVMNKMPKESRGTILMMYTVLLSAKAVVFSQINSKI